MSLFGAADGVAAVAAGVDQHLRVAVVVADADDAVLTDKGHEEVAGVGDLRFVGHEIPGAGEDPLQFQFVDLLVGEDAPVYRPLFGVNQVQHFFAVS